MNDWYSDKVILLTGARGTIGTAVAADMAKLGARLRLVYSTGREGYQKSAEEAVESLIRVSGNRDIKALYCDLGSLQDIRRMAGEFLDSGEPLHVLINNAGLFGLGKRILNADGHEMMLAVNYLAPFALTLLLLDRMKKSAPARIINVASDEYVTISNYEKYAADYNAELKYDWHQYGFSKLALIHFTRVLSQRLSCTAVSVNAMHPGSVPGNMWKGLPFLLQLRVYLVQWLMPLLAPRLLLTPEESSKTYLRLALSPDLEGMTGKYFFREQESPLKPIALNDEYANTSWQLGVRLTGLDYPPEAAWRLALVPSKPA